MPNYRANKIALTLKAMIMIIWKIKLIDIMIMLMIIIIMTEIIADDKSDNIGRNNDHKLA